MSNIKVGDSHDLSFGQLALIEQLRQNPVVAAKVLLGVDLHWYQIEAIEDFFLNNKRFALLKWSRQLGKCASKDNSIAYRKNGCLICKSKIVDFYNLFNNKNNTEYYEILTLNQETNKFEWTDNFKISYNGKKKVYNLKTALGRETVLTENHPLRKLNKWVELKDIKLKDKIAIPRKLDVFSDFDLISNQDIIMLAYLIGDGCVREKGIRSNTGRGKQIFLFSNEIQKIVKEWKNICIKLFGDSIEFRCHRKVNYDMVFPDNWDHVRNWLKKYNIWNKLSYDKSVPEQVMGTSKRQVALFLSRLFATDGWACTNYHKVSKVDSKERYTVEIGYCSVNKRLAKDVQHLLLRFGIIAKVSDKPVEYIRKDGSKCMAYQLHIGDKRSVLTFCDEIGIFGKEEAVAQCRELAASKENNNNRDVIPVEIWGYIRDKVNEKLVKDKKSQRKWLKESGVKIPRNERISLRNWDRDGFIRRKELTPQYPYAPQREKVLKYAEFLDDDYLRSLANSDLYWDEVVSVEYIGEHDTYDLAVPGPDNGGRDGKYRNFVCDDILVHNTFLESVIVALQCILYPDEVGVFLAPSQRQSLNPMNNLLRCYNNSEIMRSLVAKKTKGIMRFKNGSEITSLPMGDGCLGDSLIMTNKGFVIIDDLFGDGIIKKEKVIIDRTVYGDGEFRKIEYGFYNGYVNTKDVVTRNGYRLKGSLIHPIKIIRDNQEQWIRFNDIRVGDYAIIDRNKEWFQDTNDLDYIDSYSIGALIGDGCLVDKYRIGFSNNEIDDEIVSKVNCSLKRMVGDTLVRNKTDKEHLYLYGKDKVDKYLSYFDIDIGLYAKDKKIPNIVLGSSKKSMKWFIRGLMDTDGSVCKSNHKDSGLWIDFTNTSEKLVRQLQSILLKYGIISTVRVRNRNSKWNTIYELDITGDDVRLFSEEIGFGIDRKQKRLEKLLSEKKRFVNKDDIIPHAYFLMNKIVNNVGIVKNFKSIIRWSHISKYKRVSYTKLGFFLDKYKKYNYLEEYQELERIFENRYFYSPIEDIIDSWDKTYDLQVPNGHLFWSDGFISHNSKILGTHATIVGIDEYARFTREYVTTIILPMLNQPGANGMPNKLITLSTPLSKQNHFYQWYLTHKKYKDKANSLYHLSEYDYRDSPTIDLSIIQMSYENSSWEQFARENLGIFTDNIDGFFNNDLIYSCVEEEEGFIKIQNEPIDDKRRYVLGVDPSNMVMQDRFAIYLYEVIEYEGGTLGLQFANAWTFDKDTIPRIEDLIRRVMRVFPILRCNIDAGGGGRQIAEHLMEPKKYMDEILGEEIDWTGCKNDDVSDKTPQRGGSEVPIKIIPYSSEKKNRMFFNLKNLMTKGLFKIPKNNLHDKAYIESNLLKDELENIVTRTLPNNLLTFDHPDSVGDDRVNATALAVDAFWDVFYGQTQSSATIVRGVDNRRPVDMFGELGKSRELNYKEREINF